MSQTTLKKNKKCQKKGVRFVGYCNPRQRECVSAHPLDTKPTTSTTTTKQKEKKSPWLPPSLPSLFLIGRRNLLSRSGA
jgi:hypothetical protein